MIICANTQRSKDCVKIKASFPVFLPEEAKQVPDQRVEAPNFKEKVRNCAVGDGGSVTFQAVIAGQPLRVSWLHNGERFNYCTPENDIFIGDEEEGNGL